jgi:AraC-like DNA-binding protein
MPLEISTYRSITDLYHSFKLPLGKNQDFSIHFLPEVHKLYPFDSGLFRSEYYSFVFIKNGRGTYTVDEQCYVVKPNTLYFTNPGHLKSFQIESCEDAHLITFSEHFAYEFIHSAVFENYPFLLAEIVPPSYLNTKHFKTFEQIYSILFEEFKEQGEQQNELLGKLFEVLLLKYKELCWKPMIHTQNSDSTTLSSFKQLLEIEFKKVLDPNQTYRALNAKEYAQRLNIHPAYFNTLIKVKSGKSPNEWIRERSLISAKLLLQKTKMTVKEVGFALGYSEATHFSRFFKNQLGYSPLEYRKLCENKFV